MALKEGDRGQEGAHLGGEVVEVHTRVGGGALMLKQWWERRSRNEAALIGYLWGLVAMWLALWLLP